LKDWYVRVLGARPVWDNGQNPPVMPDCAVRGRWLEIYPANPAGRSWRQPTGRLAARGIARGFDGRGQGRIDPARREFDEETRPAAGGGKVLFFKDGEGNLLHLVERPKDWQPGKA
jgi:glyoxylase I family protein